jgi:pantothenate kinase
MVPPRAELVRRLIESPSPSPSAPSGRRLVGLVGPPGAGKSTLAGQLATASGAVVVPMDGFHLPSTRLAELDLLVVKGVPESFDARGYVGLLRRLRDDPGPVPAPAFDRVTDEPVVDAIVVPPAAVVITEGNYLLLDDPPWDEVRPQLDECWYLDLPAAERIERLVARHVRFGRDEVQARQRAIAGSDGDNARRVAATRDRADLLVWDGPGPIG